MSLFKHQPEGNESRADLRDLPIGQLPYASGSREGHDVVSDSASSIMRASMDTSSDAHSHFNRSRSASDAPSIALSLSPSTPSRQPSDYSNEAALLDGAITPPHIIGHRSTHSSPSLAPPSPVAAQAGRSRSSTLRSIFTRNGSSSFLPLSSSPGSGRSPYGQGDASVASASSVSIRSTASIGAPLPHTLGEWSLPLCVAPC
jgi:hypothetical protein